VRSQAKAPSPAPTAGSTTALDGRAHVGLLGFSALAFALLVFFVATAGASHGFTTQFGSTGSGDGQLSNPQGIAVDQTSGDLYVADTGNSRIEKFDAEGDFISAWGWGVDDGATEAQVCTSGCQAGISGSGAGQLASPKFVAVDNKTGDVYVADTTNNVVSKFSSAGAYLSTNDGTASGSAFGALAGIAVNSANALWAYDENGEMRKFAQDGSFLTEWNSGFGVSSSGIAVDSADNPYVVRGSGAIAKFEPSGGLLAEEIDTGPASGLAVDPSDDHLYADRGTSILEHRTDGSTADQFGAGDLTSATGLALRGSTSRLYAVDSGANAVAVFDFFVPPPPPPVVSGEAALEVGTTTAILSAEVNPNESATTYHFEYVDQGDFEASGFTGATKLPVPDASVGSGSEPVPVNQAIAGLDPDTTYRYRVVATSPAGETPGEAKIFKTFAVPKEVQPGQFPGQGFLPDDRAWEMVSPPDKNGGDVMLFDSRSRAAADGDAFGFASLVGFGDAAGRTLGSEYVAVRRGHLGVWSTHSITPPQKPLSIFELAVNGFEPRYLGDLSADLNGGVFVAKSPLTFTPSDPAAANVEDASNLYLRRNILSPGPGSYQLLSSSSSIQLPWSSPQEDDDPGLAGTTADFGHVIFESPRLLTADSAGLPDGVGSGSKLYQWVDGGTPPLRLVGQVPTGADTECGPSPLNPCVSAPATAGAGARQAGGLYTPHVISEDGSRIVFTGPPLVQSGSATTGTLYQRRDGGTLDPADDKTIQINASENATPGSPQPARYWDASTDGSMVFFTTTEQLTDDDQNSSDDLYRYDFSMPLGERLLRLSVDSEPLDGEESNVTGVLGASRDGRYVYFMNQSNQLVAGNPLGADSGGYERIYVWQEGNIHEVGAVDGGIESEFLSGRSSWNTTTKWSRISPDGTHLTFITKGSPELLELYGAPHYDHGSSCPFASDPVCREVYFYDATARGGSGDLVCASCDRPGTVADSDALFTLRIATGQSVPTSYLNHPMSADGHYVFFSTADALTQQDTNGVVDAYQYNTQTGKHYLLSSGTSPSPSYFLDASSDGDSVFIATRERLSRWDVDDAIDVYDARVDGGLPEPLPIPASCQGDACQPPPLGLNDTTPSSSSFSGPGSSTQRKKAKRHRKQSRAAKKRHRHRRSHHRRDTSKDRRAH
jgi:NHL repeat